MRFGFYINPVLALRNAQKTAEPDLNFISSMAEIAGAEIILLGWNPQDHIVNYNDVSIFRSGLHCDVIFVVPTAEGIADSVIKLKPNAVILASSNWDGVKPPVPIQIDFETDGFSETVSNYNSAGLPVFGYTDPDLNAVKKFAKLNFNGIVFDCTKYADANFDEEAEEELNKIENAALAAGKFGLITSFFGGVHYRNVGPLASLPYGDEIYAGGSIVNRAIVTGMERAVKDMVELIFRSSLLNK